MQVIKYIKLPFHFDAKRMQEEVNFLSANTWKLHYQTLHYEGEWRGIPLRSIGGATDNLYISPTNETYADTVFLADCPYLQEVLQNFECPLMAVRLLKLNAGAVIKEHTDAELCFEKGEVRIHIPVVTNNDVEFYLEKERIFAKEGECWYMNFNLPHSINNNSSTDRIHLVIDAQVNDWIKDLFNKNDLPLKRATEVDLYDDHVKLQMIARFREMNTPVGNQLADKLEEEMRLGKNL